MPEKKSRSVTRAQLFPVVLCLVAAFKILFFSISLPFFPEDEELHFDAIHKFATGYTRQKNLPGFDPASAEIIELYHSPEFLKVPDPGRPFLPLSWWCTPNREYVPQELNDRIAAWLELKNVEINAPPVYYIIGAAWYKLGRLMGYSGLFLLNWLRGLDAIGFGLFVFFSWMFVRECYPENRYLQIAVPIFLLVIPQDCFLFIIPNALCATFVSLTLLLLAKLCKEPNRNILFYLATGLVASATALLAFGNFLVAIPLLLAAWWIVRVRTGPPRSLLTVKTAAMLAAAALPIGLWMLNNRLTLGDWSGSKSKQDYLTWTMKPVFELFDHPLFTWDGFSYFATTLSRNFWRGEMSWGAAHRSAWIDPVYLWLSLIFFCVFVWYVTRTKVGDRTETFANVMSLAFVGCSVLFLVAISLPFDFGRCVYPSEARPYFNSGRLIIGMLLPFLIVFLRGLQIVCGWFSKRLDPLYIAIGFAALIFVTETVLFFPILSSRFTLLSFILGRSCV